MERSLMVICGDDETVIHGGDLDSKESGKERRKCGIGRKTEGDGWRGVAGGGQRRDEGEVGDA